MKTSILVGAQLDWAVAKIEGYPVSLSKTGFLIFIDPLIQCGPRGSAYSPTTDWSQGGPLIEREGIDVQQVFCAMEGSFSMPCGWQAVRHTRGGPINPPRQVADTPLIAAMRCFVASKLGDEVEIPEELK